MARAGKAAASAMAITSILPIMDAPPTCAVAAIPTLWFLGRRTRRLTAGCKPERLKRRPLGLLVEELPQARIVGILGIGDLDCLALLREIVVGLRHIHRAHVPDGLLGRTQHSRALFHELARELDGCCFELFVGNGKIDHSDAGG